MPRYHVARTIRIDAPPARVFDLVSDFDTWTTWSPWLCADPEATVTVSQPSSAVGAVYTWQGELVGQGKVEHRRLEPNRLIAEELRFIKPFRSRADVNFELQPAGSGTEVTWHMYGSLPWFMFWMQSSLEAFIGMDYERGLKMLKELIETARFCRARGFAASSR